ncbi:MAG: H-NS histone family protein [Thiolinea sp.]
MANINLDNLSVSELEQLKSGIDTAIEKNRLKELWDLREKIDDLVDNSPFTLEEVLEARSMRKPVPPKYRNPDDASQTWTGRGRKPLWVEACLENGKTMEELEIQE